MQKLSYILLAWGLSLMLGCIFCYHRGYNTGVKNTQDKIQQASIKATQQSIEKAKKDIAINDVIRQNTESETIKIQTQIRTVYKPVYERSVCESNVISDDVIDLFNKEVSKWVL